MNLTQIVASNPGLFYAQEWWKGQEFATADSEFRLSMPLGVSSAPFSDPNLTPPQPTAAALAMLFKTHPKDEIWRRFIWTKDFDAHGNRVYVGGVGFAGINKFQIHRALDYSGPLWGLAVWGDV